MGELHLEIIVDRLLREFKVDANVGKPQVAYKETVRKAVEREAKFVRQTGGRGQYGHVVLRVEPLPPGNGFEFADGTKGGVVPREYIPAVEKGVRDATETGALAGYPDRRREGHLARRLVPRGRLVRDRLQDRRRRWRSRTRPSKASPVILEPVMAVEVVVPEDFMGDVIGDLSGRRGKIQGHGCARRRAGHRQRKCRWRRCSATPPTCGR